MLYIRSSCISYFILFWFAILKILSNSRTHGESWEFHSFIFEFYRISKPGSFVLIIFSLKIFHIKYMRGDSMTSPKIMKYWRKNIKNKYLILFGFYLIFFELGKIRVFQNCILGPNKCSSCPAYF